VSYWRVCLLLTCSHDGVLLLVIRFPIVCMCFIAFASSSPAPSRSYSSSSSAQTATRANPTAANKPLAHPPAAASSPAPAQHQQPHAPQQPMQQQQQQSGGGGMLSGLMGTVVSGMAFGTGSAVAHRAVDAVMGPRQVEHVQKGDEPAAAAAATAPRAICTEQNNKFMVSYCCHGFCQTQSFYGASGTSLYVLDYLADSVHGWMFFSVFVCVMWLFLYFFFIVMHEG
jgi:hypothetical protein